MLNAAIHLVKRTQRMAASTSAALATCNEAENDWLPVYSALATSGPMICPTPKEAVMAARILERTVWATRRAASIAMVAVPMKVPPTISALPR